MSDSFPRWRAPEFHLWKQGLEALPSAEVQVRKAEPTVQDGRWMQWIQAECESIYIQSVEVNQSRIRRQLVLVAEIADHPVGFSCAFVGRTVTDPLFIQLVAVVPMGRRRGAALALLSRSAGWEPNRDVAMATLDENIPARSLNERLAESMGSKMERVPVRRYRRSDLGFAEGERHKPWLISRSAV